MHQPSALNWYSSAYVHCSMSLHASFQLNATEICWLGSSRSWLTYSSEFEFKFQFDHFCISSWSGIVGTFKEVCYTYLISASIFWQQAAALHVDSVVQYCSYSYTSNCILWVRYWVTVIYKLISPAISQIKTWKVKIETVSGRNRCYMRRVTLASSLKSDAI